MKTIPELRCEKEIFKKNYTDYMKMFQEKHPDEC